MDHGPKIRSYEEWLAHLKQLGEPVCEECGGEGKLKCDKCGGTGECGTCHAECTRCYGITTVRCEKCKGRDLRKEYEAILVHDLGLLAFFDSGRQVTRPKGGGQ